MAKTSGKNISSVNFGVNEIGVSLIKKIDNYNYMLDIGKKEEADPTIITSLLNNICFDPKKETIINAKVKKDAKDKEALTLIKERESLVGTLPLLKELSKINSLIPEGFALKCKEIHKKVNNKRVKMNYLPGSLTALYKPHILTAENMPTSLVTFMFKDNGKIETGDHVFSLDFISVVYNPLTYKYELHKWNVLYILEPITITKETQSKYMDEMFS